MIRINNIRLTLDESEDLLLEKIAKRCHTNPLNILNYKIVRKSIDARKDDIKIIYTLDVQTKKDKYLIKTRKLAQSDVMPYKYPIKGEKALKGRPTIIGAGPCGLFTALILAEMGYQPLIIERGKPVEIRIQDVENFWNHRILNLNSNVQFGEGGAGTFSDGKLTTQIKNVRCRKVLEEFIKFGAPDNILYKNKPHIGTDLLRNVIIEMRKEIERLGGTFRFNTKLIDLNIINNKLQSITVESLLDNTTEDIPTTVCVLALGHSARDTFKMLKDTPLKMEQKIFSMGIRIEHLQEWINSSQYGQYYPHPNLDVADYKLVYDAGDNRKVYSFCMCPGGYVVGASSESEKVATNGMSYYSRDGQNANSALLINITKEDLKSDDVLEGIYLQEKLESLAFDIAGKNYNAPIQRVEDFLNNVPTVEVGIVKPTYKPNVTMVNLRKYLPDDIATILSDAIVHFGKIIENFDHKDAIITGFETRSSSPIKIVRDSNFESNIKGIYPAGEGAGYAGGIMSAAVDGIQIAEKIVSEFLF
ncbi:MAG: hypothetical protein ATN31_03725 [Candidatus Epulonipiscioides saccharophilum]|nr:MAG: hypothetical protein ATN31_03725 [Epulopiscium sp. AS2M-Bin001]